MKIEEITLMDVDRFLLKVKIKHGDCWSWLGAKSGNGYGAISINNKRVGAHRMSYLLHNGDTDETKDICHKCDNPTCVNPDHLFQGTRSENMKDCAAKKRLFNQKHPERITSRLKTSCRNGHPYLPSNLLITKGKYRRCKICTYKSNGESYRRRNNG